MREVNVLLYSTLPQIIQGGIAVWTNTYIHEANKHCIKYTLINNAAVGKRSENPEARLSIHDELLRTTKIFRSLRKKLQSGNYDVAHINTSCGPFGIIRDAIVTRIIKKKGIKVIVHFHCDIPFWVKNSLSKYVLRKMVENSDCLFVLCKNSESFLLSEYGRKSSFIPNFISSKDIIDNKSISDKYDRVLYVGGIQPEKGSLEMLSVAKLYPTMSFVMVGQQNHDLESIQAPANVQLTGSLTREKVFEEMDLSDLFLFPSHSEGFSLALTEAMARGLPIIATDVGANSQMIEDEGGIIVPVGDVQALSKAIHKLANSSLRKKCSMWNINKVKKYYTTDAVMLLLHNYYIELLK